MSVSEAEGTAIGAIDFDPDALRERYRIERRKRLRSDGLAQYIPLEAELEGLDADPWIEEVSGRAPVHDEVEILIIGGGFSALSLGARLRMRNIHDFRIVEKGADFGGAWHWNRYPDAQCDIESYIYLPLLEETGYIPKEKYSHQPEILEHVHRIAKQYDLYRDVFFQTIVTGCRWDDERGRWIVATNVGDEIAARFVVKTTGVNDKPKLPGIPGITSFKGHMFHTSRWDYGYTGGDTTGGLHKLADKRVAVIGTGSTAISVIPALARHAKRLYVVQRTPAAVNVRGNRPTDPDWAKTLTPGWQKRRRENFVGLTSGVPQPEDLVADAWTESTRRVGGFFVDDLARAFDGSAEDFARMLELEDFKIMNELRGRVDTLVEDPLVAEALKPWYRQWCKRPTFSDEYLAAFNRPSVTLLDTDGKGEERITERGVVVAGTEYEVDLIIFSTGFEAGTPFAHRAGYETYGRGGCTLSDAWKNSFQSLHGFYVHGFPNMFHMTLSQNGVSYLRTYMLDEQAEHIADMLRECRERRATRVEPTQEAQSEWQVVIKSFGVKSNELQETCTPSWFNNEGMGNTGNGIADNVYGGGPLPFYELIREWRGNGEWEGLAFT